MRIIFNIGLIFGKDFRIILRELFLELDMKKVRIDESDWYFCLRREGYDFRGKNLKQRLAIAKRIDLKKGHILVKGLYEIKTTKTPKLNVQVPSEMLVEGPEIRILAPLGDRPRSGIVIVRK